MRAAVTTPLALPLDPNLADVAANRRVEAAGPPYDEEAVAGSFES